MQKMESMAFLQPFPSLSPDSVLSDIYRLSVLLISDIYAESEIFRKEIHKSSMKLQRLLSLVRKAVDDYQLIDENDKIAIGISGGKDSLALLYAMQALRRFYPRPFELHGFTVDLGFGTQDFRAIEALCSDFEVPYTVIPTDIASVVFESRKENNPCSLCAKMRKGALNQAALDAGCTKVAYAHHRDDIIETMMLSLIYEGRFYTFSPRTYLDRTGLTVIRPMMYAGESDIIGFKNKYQLPVCKNPCPVDGKTKREYVKKLVASLNQENPGVKDRFFHAVLEGKIEGWPEKYVRKDAAGRE